MTESCKLIRTTIQKSSDISEIPKPHIVVATKSTTTSIKDVLVQTDLATLMFKINQKA